jgi:hypothetical protein
MTYIFSLSHRCQSTDLLDTLARVALAFATLRVFSAAETLVGVCGLRGGSRLLQAFFRVCWTFSAWGSVAFWGPWWVGKMISGMQMLHLDITLQKPFKACLGAKV